MERGGKLLKAALIVQTVTGLWFIIIVGQYLFVVDLRSVCSIDKDGNFVFVIYNKIFQLTELF